MFAPKTHDFEVGAYDDFDPFSLELEVNLDDPKWADAIEMLTESELEANFAAASAATRDALRDRARSPLE